MKLLTVLAGLILVLALASGTYASVAYYEGFAYTAGGKLLDNGYENGVGGLAWDVQAGSIAYSGLVTTGNKAYSLTTAGNGGTVLRALPAAATTLFQSAGTFYITFLASGNNGFLGLGMLDDPQFPTSLTDDVVVGQFSDQGEGGAYAERLILPGWDSGWDYTYSSLNLYALKIVNDGTGGADTVQMVRNPVLSSGEPNWATSSEESSTTANITGAVDGLRLSSSYYSGSPLPREMSVDEIRIATTWAEVAPYEPPLTPPTAPTGLSASALSDVRIDLAWTDNASDETNYVVERSPDGTGSWVQIEELAAGVEAYQNVSLDPETTYFYRVYAYNGAGPSGYSNVANATTGVAVVPNTVTYQGKLTNASGTPVADGPYTFVFKTFDIETGGTVIWTSADTVASTSGGLFTAKIRNVPIGAFPANAHVWMEIVVNGETLTPRIEVGSDPYSLRAGQVGP